eukprot:snap_masked-scaffold_27-processed-gene-0.23-mRNA-1 protein AED:1.00 eAED:1.00 QI:0/-1/0/0/-1/1/1/0/179
MKLIFTVILIVIQISQSVGKNAYEETQVFERLAKQKIRGLLSSFGITKESLEEYEYLDTSPSNSTEEYEYNGYSVDVEYEYINEEYEYQVKPGSSVGVGSEYEYDTSTCPMFKECFQPVVNFLSKLEDDHICVPEFSLAVQSFFKCQAENCAVDCSALENLGRTLDCEIGPICQKNLRH